MPFRMAVAAGLFAFALPVSAEDVSSDGVPVTAVYLDEKGNGILRYEDPAGGTEEYVATVGGLSQDSVRPFEIFGALGGPWTGPKVAICIEGVRTDRMASGFLAFELYSNTTQMPVMRYRPVFDAAKAEEIRSVGEGAGPGECSRKYAP